MNEINKVVLAFSGGLDTTFCVKYIQEKYNAEVITVTVDSGGFSEEEKTEIEKKSKNLGAIKHYTVNVKKEMFDKHITTIIKANALYEGLYPLCCPVERLIIAEKVIEIAKKENADAVSHGSTGAGNDQVRFDVAFSTLAPDLKVIDPIRELGLSRKQEIEYLESKNINVPVKSKKYSINENILGRTIGGSEFNTTIEEPKIDCYSWVNLIEKTPNEPEYLTIEFENGIPISLNSKKTEGHILLQELNKLAGKHGIGMFNQTSDDIIGIKGRIGFEIPGIYTIIKAHEALEWITLTKNQLSLKKILEQKWTENMFHAIFFDPINSNIKKFIDDSQKSVTGIVKIKLFKGNLIVIGYDSNYSLTGADIATYAEKPSWDGKTAENFIKIYGFPQKIAYSKGDKK